MNGRLIVLFILFKHGFGDVLVRQALGRQAGVGTHWVEETRKLI